MVWLSRRIIWLTQPRLQTLDIQPKENILINFRAKTYFKSFILLLFSIIWFYNSLNFKTSPKKWAPLKRFREFVPKVSRYTDRKIEYIFVWFVHFTPLFTFYSFKKILFYISLSINIELLILVARSWIQMLSNQNEYKYGHICGLSIHTYLISPIIDRALLIFCKQMLFNIVRVLKPWPYIVHAK